MFEKITKTLSGLAFIKYINSLIDYVNTSDIDATRIKGQLDISNIPPAGLDNVIKVDTVTDMLALTVDDVQNGDTVMIIGVTPPVQYQVVDDTKLGTMDAFQEYAAGTATKLATARTINGVPFDGTKDITIGIPEFVIASEAEAKAGTNNTKFMTPLRVKQAIEAQVPIKEIVNSIYPVGQIVEYASNINPNDLYSWQTWEQIKDVFTLSAGDKYTIGDTGGAATVTLTIDQIPAHWHTATASNDGEHIHSGVAKRNVNWQAGSDWTSDSGNLVESEGNTDNAGGHSHKIEIQNTGGDAAHNNMPPYLVTIKWKRTS